MAQTIQIANATYPDVPSIVCNKSGGGTAVFADPSGVDAVAADVAQGKWFLTNQGVLTQGTASGGGTFTPVMGAIRPDATLVKKWTYDKRYVQDLGGTIPSYSTSSTTLVASANLSPTIDITGYDAIVIQRVICVPIYGNATHASGREDYFFGVASSEHDVIQSGSEIFKSIDGSTTYTANLTQSIPGSIQQAYRLVYWNSSSKMTMYNGTNGLYGNLVYPGFSSGVITAKSPAFYIKGNTNYLNQTAWNNLTDLRLQYVIELYKYPINGNDTDGWTLNMQLCRIANCIRNGGTLT